MEVRRAELRDVEAIAVVHVESWRSTYRGVVPDDYLDGLSVERRMAAWREMVGDGAADRGVLVLEDGGAVVGFCHYSPNRDGDAEPTTAEITAIYLLASHWRHGGGSRLLDAALEAAKSAGFNHVTLWVLDGNATARRFSGPPASGAVTVRSRRAARSGER